MTHYYAIRPLDPVMFRGNRSFGAAGEHGECQMPPWPSAFAGAFRAAMLGRDPEVLARFNKRTGPNSSEWQHLDGRLGEILGTPADPGSFELTWASLAVESDGKWSPAIPLPTDLVIQEKDQCRKSGNRAEEIQSLLPAQAPAGSHTSYSLPLLPILRQQGQAKPASGRWLPGKALQLYLDGQLPKAAKTIQTKDLYEKEVRVGVALDPATRSVEEGALYSTEAISFSPNAGFLAGIGGISDGDGRLLPAAGLLRLGGDGRGAEYRQLPDFSPLTAPWEAIGSSRKFRLILATPGIFAQGWLPPQVEKKENEFRLQLDGFSARLAAAAIPRQIVISGWDIANWAPKPAERAVPAGAVYWFDQMDGDPDKLAAWVEHGIWGNTPDKQRQAEGFNRGLVAAWQQEG